MQVERSGCCRCQLKLSFCRFGYRPHLFGFYLIMILVGRGYSIILYLLHVIATKMNSFSIWIVLTGLSLTGCASSGPENVVVFVGQTAALSCFRPVPGHDIRWYIVKDTNQWVEIHDVMRNYRTEGSGEGHHWLFIDNIQLDQSGLYICRSQAKNFTSRGANVVTVPYPPLCRTVQSNKTSTVLDCWITYGGNLNAMIVWKDSSGRILEKRSFSPSSEWLSSHNLLLLTVIPPDEMNEYICEVNFFARSETDDIADNKPNFPGGTCRVTRERDSKTAMTESNNTFLIPFLVTFSILIVISICAVWLVFKLKHRKKCAEDGVQGNHKSTQTSAGEHLKAEDRQVQDDQLQNNKKDTIIELSPLIESNWDKNSSDQPVCFKYSASNLTVNLHPDIKDKCLDDV